MVVWVWLCVGVGVHISNTAVSRVGQMKEKEKWRELTHTSVEAVGGSVPVPVPVVVPVPVPVVMGGVLPVAMAPVTLSPSWGAGSG